VSGCDGIGAGDDPDGIAIFPVWEIAGILLVGKGVAGIGTVTRGS
jgi:hypothetical protein